jgi:CRP/FNR family transcriptional regulator, cyclic AMP receptor protein
VETDELLTRLAGIDVFQGLSKRDLKKLTRSGRQTQHGDGHEVIVEGSGALGFHLITAGEARVTTGSTVRRTLGVGDYFGEISVIDGLPRSASVEAVGSLETFAVHPVIFEKILDDHPDFARGLMMVLCKRLRESEQRSS